jgi:predicted neuraminidase
MSIVSRMLELFAWGAVTVGAAAPTVAGTPPGEVESKSVVFADSHTDPYDRANLYGLSHAASVTSLGGDRVMAVWFAGPFEGSVHQVLLGAISEDGGKTWGDATVVNDAPRTSDFDPGFVNAANRLLLFFSTGRWETNPPQGPGMKTGVDSFQMFVKESRDGGRTWSEMRDIHTTPGWNSRSNGIRLQDGTLLVPTHHLQYPHKSSVLLSNDDGETWTRGAAITAPDEVGAAEPSVTQLPDGSLLMVLRTTDGHLWLVRSTDGGKNWSQPERQEMTAATSSANLWTTAKGQVVLTHNPTKPPERTELTMRVLDEDGKSWSDPLTLEKVEPTKKGDPLWNRQISYPSVCELPDGTLVVVWAFIEQGRETQRGEIHSARVRLN